MTLALHPTLKKVLVILAKNSVYAVLTNSALMIQWHDIFNFNNLPGLWAVTRLTATVIITREGVIWLPVLLKWSQTNASPDEVFKESLRAAEESAKQSQVAAKESQASAKETVSALQDVKDAAKDAAKAKDK